MLVVLTIISIIAAFLMPNLFGVKDRAKELGVKSVMRSAQMAIETYNMENTYFPLGSGITLRQLCDDYMLDPGYIGEVPKNPFTGREYSVNDTAGKILYFYDEAKESYRLVGYKKNGMTVLMELSGM